VIAMLRCCERLPRAHAVAAIVVSGKEEAPNSNLWGFSGFLRGAQGTYGGRGDAPTTRP
jgi:hypothetical protein